MFVDEAVEALSQMEHTCALDFVEANGEGDQVLARDIGEALGVTKQQVLRDVEAAQMSARAEAERRDLDTRPHHVEHARGVRHRGGQP